MADRTPWNHGGASRHKRGYGAAWDKLRKRILERDKYLCQPCLIERGRPTPATQVDHKQPKAHGGTDDPENLRSICRPCHFLVGASAFAAFAARPVTFYFSGNQPSQWFQGRRNELAPMLGGEAENYEARIVFNDRCMSSSKRAVDRALMMAVVAPLAALLGAGSVCLL